MPNYSTFSGVINPELESLAETQEASRWRENEINLTEDYGDFMKLKPNERRMFANTLSFLAIADGLINKNLLTRFIEEVADPSARRFYLFQTVMEDVHARTYGLMLQAVVPDRDERERLLKPHENSEAINAKIKWIEKWIEGDYPFCQRLLAFAIAESILFSPSFVPFYWAKKRGILHGLSLANDFIAKDEGLHCVFALTLNKYLGERCTDEVIHQMMREAVEVENVYIDETLPEGIEELSNAMLKDYIKAIADAWLPQFINNYGKPCAILFKKENPIHWIDRINIRPVSEFFERRDGNYTNISNDQMKVEFDTDF
jgi:ribonucleoside-diphosphate reductase beta chain